MSYHLGTRVGEYRSKLEKRVADRLKKLKLGFTFESQKLSYTVQKTYTPDMLLEGEFKDVFFEVKGVLLGPDRSKMLNVKKAHPDVPIIFVFSSPNKKCPGLKSTHAEWAEKNGFPCLDAKDFNRKGIRDCLKAIKS